MRVSFGPCIHVGSAFPWSLPVCAGFLFDVFLRAVPPGMALVWGDPVFWRLLSPETGAASVTAIPLVCGHTELGVPVGQSSGVAVAVAIRCEFLWLLLLLPSRKQGTWPGHFISGVYVTLWNDLLPIQVYVPW